MSDYLFLFLIILSLIVVLLRADFVLTLIYLLLATYVFGRWWGQRALQAVSVKRVFTQRVFLGEKIPVRLKVVNTGLLPVVWLQIQESLPFELGASGAFRRVASLGSLGRLNFEYQLEGRKRGYYRVGPLSLHSGDLFGILPDQVSLFDPDYLVVYPKIVPLTRLSLPSRSPMGTLRHQEPVYEDPSRVLGKREYVTGDSLRRVDWKSSASTGRLQVKLFEPSIALETAIFLNLNVQEYGPRSRFDATELGIIVAASLANWITGQRQAVGLFTNGLDPLSKEKEMTQPVLPGRGRSHLIRVLDVLARVQAAETVPLVELLQRQIVQLPWGVTLILITPQIDDPLFEALFQARRAGLNAFLVPCGPLSSVQEIRRRAGYFGFPLVQILTEKDLDLWRQ